MNEFDFLQNVSFGQYRPGTGWLYNLHPALKLVALILCSAMVFASPLTFQLPLLFLLFAFAALSAGLGFFPLLKGVRPVLPFLFFIALIQIFFITRDYGSEALFVWGRFEVHDEDLLFTGRLFGRFFALFLLFSLFTSVTTVSELSHGSEMLFRLVFRKGGFSHDAALVLTITFRFIPLLLTEAEQISKAQASRGASFGTWKMGFIKKMRLYIPLLVPLFVAALERAEILVQAMEARCYEPGRERSRMDDYPWTRRDGLILSVLILSVLALLGSIVLV